MEDNLKDFRPSEIVKKRLENKKLITNDLKAGKSVQEILGFGEEVMKNFCAAAYVLFHEKHYQEAANAFLFLTTLNSSHCEYWLGLGMATQFCGEYEEAIDAYELAAICDIANPLPYFYLAKCLFAVHDRSGALQALELTLELTEDEEAYSEIRQQAELARDLLLS